MAKYKEGKRTKRKDKGGIVQYRYTNEKTRHFIKQPAPIYTECCLHKGITMACPKHQAQLCRHRKNNEIYYCDYIDESTILTTSNRNMIYTYMFSVNLTDWPIHRFA